MVLNYIWIGFFLVALVVAVVRTIGGEAAIFGDMVNATFEMAEVAFEISIGLTGILCLWMGIMKIGEMGGSVKVMSRIVGPFFDRLFPEVPKDHPARGSMLFNFTANMLGLDNAATPAGLRAMNQLQELNEDKDRATNAMIMFLVLNTSGLTIIPVTVMTYRSQFGAENPADIFIPILIATFCASLVGLITVALYQRINLWDKVIMAYLLGMTGIIVGIIWYFTSLSPDQLETQSSLLSNIILYGIICTFILMAIRKKVNVYETFIEGAKGGFEIAIKIIPYLVAILVSIGVFRTSGALEYMQEGLAWFFGLFLENTEFVKGLPTAFMKPLSGSGARGMMLDAFAAEGVDSFVGKLTATLQGATDTTFYIIAVYFGAVGIKKTRYAVKAGLIADFAGIIAGIVIATIWFGGDVHQTKSEMQVAQEFGDAIVMNDRESATNLLDENCVLYDQSYDTLYHNGSDIVERYFLAPISLSEQRTIDKLSQIEEENQKSIYLKINNVSDSSSFKKTYELNIEKHKIISIKYLGDL